MEREKLGSRLGFLLLSAGCAIGIEPLGPGTQILDLEDFIVSNFMLPLGSVIFLLFCVLRYGWGWNAFMNEANQGKGVKMKGWMRPYLTFILPVIVIVVFIMNLK